MGPIGRREVTGNRRKRVQGASGLDLGIANPSRAEANFQSVGTEIVAERIGDFWRGLVVDHARAGWPSEVRHSQNRDARPGATARKPVVGLPPIVDLATKFVDGVRRDSGNDLYGPHMGSVNEAVALGGEVLPADRGGVVVGGVVGMMHVPNRDPVARVYNPIGL